ncbi:MAG: urea transporter [Leptospiraceae bacterium]|nr:urea transporter [Leptospiraceae bacterium]
MVYYLKLIIDSTLLGYSTILFSTNKKFGFLIMLSTFFNPAAGLTGLLGTMFSNLLVLFIGVHEDRIRKGLYGFNGLLVGLSVSLYHEVDISLIIILFVTSILLVFVTLSLEHLLGYFLGLPVLSFPFVIVSIILYLAFFNYSTLKTKVAFEFPLDSYFPKIPSYLLFYVKSLSGIFFQSSPWAGFIFAILLFINSRIAFFLSFAGFFAGALFQIGMGSDITDLEAGIVGFNFILTAIAVGGVFLVPTPFTFILGIMAALVSAIIASFTKIFLVTFNIPVLALPFVTVSLMFLYVTRLLRNQHLRVLDFLPGSPEENLDYYKTRLERFGDKGILINLPFSGKWMVSQGYNGKYTHQELWKESLDFMAVGQDGKVRRGKTSELSDYYTYGLPALAPASGRIIKIVNHLEDNIPGEVDIKNNWGNFVLIEHSQFLFSQISHLQKDTITVKEGDYITIGTKLGLAGNSGRSPEPHIHLHFQSTPEVGSATTPVNFIQFAKKDKDKTKIVFNEIPDENDIIFNLSSDFNLKSFYSLAPGISFEIEVIKNNQTPYKEKWKSGLDFWGNRFLEDGEENKIYFFLARDYFSCLDFTGKTSSALFQFYLANYRVPFSGSEGFWMDRISYKYFSTPYVKFIKDLVHPFSDKVSYYWKAEIENTNSGSILKSGVFLPTESTITDCKIEFSGSFPGIISTKNKKDSWVLKTFQDSTN